MEINLPILASILTIVGYSLNDTIVVFDRIRENYTAGRGGSNLYEIINTSLNETLSRTLITSLTTVFAVATIAIVGSGLIENFAITLLIGVIIGTYSSICVASPIMLMMDTFMRNRQKAKDLIAARETTVEPSEA
jgi:preprotein translocase SecF subunit